MREPERAAPTATSIWKLTRYLRGHAGSLSIIGISLLLQTGFRLSQPLAYRWAFDVLVPAHDVRGLLWLSLALFAAWSVALGGGFVQDSRTAAIATSVVGALRDRMHRTACGRAEILRLQSDKADDVLTRFSVDISVIEHLLARGMPRLLLGAVLLVSTLGLAFYLDWRLTVVALIAIPIPLFVPKLLGSWARRRAHGRAEAEGQLAAFFEEDLTARDLVRAFGAQDYRRTQFAQQLGDWSRSSHRAHVSSALVARTASQLVFLLQVGLVMLGAYFVVVGSLTAGTLLGFAQLMLNLTTASNHLTNTLPELYQADAAYARVDGWLSAARAQRDDRPGRGLARLRRGLECRDVSFAYPEADPVLRGLSLSIPAGSSVAIVGRSGAGKTTLLNVLLGLLKPASGTIRFDGVELADVDERALREQFAVVPQRPQLFRASVRDNLALGREHTEFALRTAARMAEIDARILRESRGYDTLIGDGQITLSSGELQRLALARALLRDPSVLVLDEYTSALDAETETRILSHLQQVRRGRTVLCVTHRLAAARHMDRIVVLDAGRIVEDGSHEQLIACSGLYAQLWEQQNAFEIDEESDTVRCRPEALSRIPLLSCLDRLHLERAARLLVPERYPPGRVIFEEGDPGNRLFVVAQGGVQLTRRDARGRPARLDRVHEGDYFGELAILDDARRNATAITDRPTVLLSLSRSALRELFRDAPVLRTSMELQAVQRRTVPPQPA